MATRPIRILVGGSPRHGSSAPTVDDLLDQIRDFMYVLRATEEECHGNAKLRWHVTNASMQSPLALELTPVSTAKDTDTDLLASSVIDAAYYAVNHVITTGRQPKQVTDATFNKINSIVNRVTNGLASFEANFSGYDGAKNIYIDVKMAAAYSEKMEESKSRKPSSAPRWEQGSMEGYTEGVATNQRGEAILRLRSRLTGNIVNCVDSEGSLEKIGDVKVREILDNMRIRVNGLLHYKNLDIVDKIKVDHVYIYPHNDKLTDLEFLTPINITGGLSAVEYLRKLHNGE